MLFLLLLSTVKRKMPSNLATGLYYIIYLKWLIFIIIKMYDFFPFFLVLTIHSNLLFENYYSKPDTIYKMKPWGLVDTNRDTIKKFCSFTLFCLKPENSFKFSSFRIKTNKQTSNAKVFSKDLLFLRKHSKHKVAKMKKYCP